MTFADSHAHVYLSQFQEDRKEIIERAIQNNIAKMYLPNVDSQSMDSLIEVCEQFPENCFAMLGLHPTYVKEDFTEELNRIYAKIKEENIVAIGEIGIDLYWDKTFVKQQIEVFETQLQWALDLQLPVAVHIRNSFNETFETLSKFRNKGLKGVFHCFGGNMIQAEKAIEMGFYLGIGGTLTYKNSGVQNVVKEIDLQHIILETDAPYLTPEPFRGKRNEPAYIVKIAEKIAELKNCDLEEVAEKTYQNTISLFHSKL